MGGYRCDHEEERLVSSHGVVKKTISLFRQQISDILAVVFVRRVMVSLEGRVVVVVRERIEKKVLCKSVTV